MVNLVDGVKRHRAFGRRSVGAYNSHLSNAIHFAAVRDDETWIVEPLGWALLVARGGDPELATQGDSHSDAEMQAFVAEGWKRIDEGQDPFEGIWIALQDRLRARKIALSARKSLSAIFWIAPGSAFG